MSAWLTAGATAWWVFSNGFWSQDVRSDDASDQCLADATGILQNLWVCIGGKA